MSIQCPCCGNYTIDSDDEVIVDICEVCHWQFDEVAHDHPDAVKGANRVTLNEAKKNYAKYGACEERFENSVRKPFLHEMPQTNQ